LRQKEGWDTVYKRKWRGRSKRAKYRGPERERREKQEVRWRRKKRGKQDGGAGGASGTERRGRQVKCYGRGSGQDGRKMRDGKSDGAVDTGRKPGGMGASELRTADFLRDKSLLLLLHLACMGALAGFLYLTGYSGACTALILIFWVLLLGGWLWSTYLLRRNYFREAGRVLEKLDQRYLLGELLPDSFRLEDRLYRELIRKSNKSVIERIRQIEEEQKSYREYIESWVHEVKTPIANISLLCDNRRRAAGEGEALREAFRTVSLENQRIENYVDMALYYARSEEVYKDYLIRATKLDEVVLEVLDKNRLLMIGCGVRVQVDCAELVYTDRKWVSFILNQMLLNSVKYRSSAPSFSIYAGREKNGVTLVLEDNGTGIRKEELSRIFEKGFTGSNGRDHERATGMGLYLCRKLCGKLGIGLRAESEYGSGTKMYLEFPLSNYIERGVC